MKICSRCKEEKELSEFSKNKASLTDGHRPDCKKCCNQQLKQYRSESKDKTKQYAKEFIDRTPNAKECPCCKITKSKTEYHTKRYYTDGLATYCKDCTNVKSKEKYLLNKSKGIKRKRTLSEKIYQQKWYQDNKEELKIPRKEYAASTKARERVRELNRTKYKANRVFHTAKRRALQKHSLPGWLTKEQREEIKLIYHTAHHMTVFHETEFEVDHIEPLIGKTSCGLTIPWNLRVIHWTENRTKGNKLI